MSARQLPVQIVTVTLLKQTLTMQATAAYLSLGSPQAAERWLRAHKVRIFPDELGYNRAWVKEIQNAEHLCYAEAETKEHEQRQDAHALTASERHDLGIALKRRPERLQGVS